MKVQKHTWRVFKTDSDYDKLECSLFFSKRNFLKKQDPALKFWNEEDYHKYYSMALGAFSNLSIVLREVYGYVLIVERSTLLFARRDGGVVPENSLYEAYNGIHFSCITDYKSDNSSLWDINEAVREVIGTNRPLLKPFLSYNFKCTEDKITIRNGFSNSTYGMEGNIWNAPRTKLLYIWFNFKNYYHFPFVMQVTRYVSTNDGMYLYNPNLDTERTRIPSYLLPPFNNEEFGEVDMYGHKFFTYPEKYIDEYLDLRYGNWREDYIKVHGRTTFS